VSYNGVFFGVLPKVGGLELGFAPGLLLASNWDGNCFDLVYFTWPGVLDVCLRSVAADLPGGGPSLLMVIYL
jgi:hypothetical protein